MKHAVLTITTALVLAFCGVPGSAHSERTTGCASKSAAIVTAPHFTLPEGTILTKPFIAFDLDVGSDGRVRDVHSIVGTGDKVIDALLRSALQAATYVPAQTGCVAVSSVLRFVTSTHDQPSPAPEPTPIVLPRPTLLTDACVPLVDTFIFPVKRDRAKTGTAIVAVPIDAAGAIDGQPKIEKRTGSATLDVEALRIATTGKYRFMDHDACRPQPITYYLELRFE